MINVCMMRGASPAAGTKSQTPGEAVSQPLAPFGSGLGTEAHVVFQGVWLDRLLPVLPDAV